MSPLPSSLPTVIVPAGSNLWRIHRSEHGAVWFGPAPGAPPDNRFDAPAGEYRICYLGDSPEVSFAETLIRRPRTRLLQRVHLAERSFSRIPVNRDLRVAQLHGAGLVRIGIGADVVHGHSYAACQALALDLWRHNDAVDGIAYRSRWDNDRLCVALFDRAGGALGAPDYTAGLADSHLVPRIFRLYDVGLE